METIRVETRDLTFDVSVGADGKVYLIIEGVGVSGEEVMDWKKAAELSAAFLAAAKAAHD